MLLTLGITATVLLLIAQAWLHLGALELPTLHWTAEAAVQGILLGAGISIVGEVLYRFWHPFHIAVLDYMTLVLKPLEWWDVLWLGFLPGLSEELLFRGVAVAAFGLSWPVIILTGCIFGLLHLIDLRYWSYGVWATGIGIALGASLLLTDNLAVPVIAHVMTNLVAGFGWKYRFQQLNAPE